MEQKTLYTAIGRLERETNGCGRSCPVIRLGGQPYMVDMQELVVWTALNWRFTQSSQGRLTAPPIDEASLSH